MPGLLSTMPQQGGLNYMDYPNPYGVRAYPIYDKKKRIIGYGGEMLPKSVGWLGLLQGAGDLAGSNVTEFSADDEKGSFPLVVPTLDEVERNKIRKGTVTKEMYKKAMEYRDLMESIGMSPFYNPFNYGK